MPSPPGRVRAAVQRLNPLISRHQVDSRILFVRDVRERVEKLARSSSSTPTRIRWCLDGRVVYMIDGYTTTDRYPYAQQADTVELPADSGLSASFNYVRNSVKATVDAYDGTVTALRGRTTTIR